MLHDPITTAFPFSVVLAQATAAFSWEQTLLVYGPLGLWVAWFVIRDRQERQERQQERADLQKRHEENLAAMKKIEEAYRTHTDLLIVGLAAMKTIDLGYSGLLEKLKDSNVQK